jgi:hypothetical protein
MKSLHSITTYAALFVSFAVSTSAQIASSYTVATIPNPTGFVGLPSMSGINNAGQVAGFGYFNSTSPLAFVGSPGGSVQIPFSSVASAFAISNSSQVVGSFMYQQNGNQAFIGTTAGGTALPFPRGWTNSGGYAVNNSGQVAGSLSNSSTSEAFIGTTSGLTVIPLPSGWTSSLGNGVNNSGQVVGYGFNGTGTQAFIGGPAGSTPVPVPNGGGNMFAYAINDSGQIAGYVSSGQAYIGTQSGVTLLPLPAGSAPGTKATVSFGSLNNLGMLVGLATGPSPTFTQSAWIWDPAHGTLPMNTLVPAGWNILNAVSISDTGLILALATFNGGADQWVELSPSLPYCATSLSPTGQPASAAAAAGSFTVNAPGGCMWQAYSNDSWLTLTSGNSGTGPGTVNFQISANAGPGTRVGTITAGGIVYTVTQVGSATHFSVSAPGSATAGVPVQFTVTALDASNSPVAGYSGAVHFTSTDGSATLPGNATVTNGVGIFTASLVTAGVQTLTVTDLTNVSVTGTSGNITVSAAAGLRFIPVTPCRVADTRNATGPFGGPLISGGTSRDFAIPSSACGIPSTAQAYSLNVAVVPSTTLGYLTVWPTGQTLPGTATLNSLDGRIKSSAAIVPAGTSGAISVFAADSTQVILDINGYFVPASTPGALSFYPVTPCRLVDTRNGTLLTSGFSEGQTQTLPILSSSCNVPNTAQAYSLNFVAVPTGRVGYLTAYPTGVTRPFVATLNDLTGTIAANAAIVPAGSGGSIDVFAADGTQLVVDITGYFAPPGAGGLSLYNLPPCRVLDTRQPPGSPAFTGELDVNVIGAGCGGTSSAQAYVLNATVVPPARFGYLTMWPQGTTLPLAATLNATDGAITNNLAVVPTNNTEISVFASDLTHLILDIFGYFAP